MCNTQAYLNSEILCSVTSFLQFFIVLSLVQLPKLMYSLVQKKNRIQQRKIKSYLTLNSKMAVILPSQTTAIVTTACICGSCALLIEWMQTVPQIRQENSTQTRLIPRTDYEVQYFKLEKVMREGRKRREKKQRREQEYLSEPFISQL